MVIILVIFESVRVDDIDFFLGPREEGRLACFFGLFLFVLFSGLLSFYVFLLLKLSDLPKRAVVLY